jgi:hypothetical protein
VRRLFVVRRRLVVRRRFVVRRLFVVRRRLVLVRRRFVVGRGTGLRSGGSLFEHPLGFADERNALFGFGRRSGRAFSVMLPLRQRSIPGLKGLAG